MFGSNWTTIISASVVPVVIISACGLLCLAFYNRLTSIVTRLRSFQRERIQEQERLLDHDPPVRESMESVERHRKFLQVLDNQTVRGMRRARLIRNTLMSLLTAISCLLVCSLTMGLSVIYPIVQIVAATMFLAGVGMILLAMIFAMIEIHLALQPIELEAQFVHQMTRDLLPSDDDADSV
jgi:hypothetical protein